MLNLRNSFLCPPLNARLEPRSGGLITADFQGHRIQGCFFTEVPLQAPLLHLAVALVVLPVRAVLVVGDQARAGRQVASVLLLLSVRAAEVVHQQIRLGGLSATLLAEIGVPVKKLNF